MTYSAIPAATTAYHIMRLEKKDDPSSTALQSEVMLAAGAGQI